MSAGNGGTARESLPVRGRATSLRDCTADVLSARVKLKGVTQEFPQQTQTGKHSTPRCGGASSSLHIQWNRRPAGESKRPNTLIHTHTTQETTMTQIGRGAPCTAAHSLHAFQVAAHSLVADALRQRLTQHARDEGVRCDV
ncbi:uncharacterized protein Tco025E_03336 [Trypanosoma conorhini]|uniref:Uncharacterized protein n=1 Tax=Trypanosoma conorhini TaxID=83891 RepID=A0A422PV50_9TRYP|nr:uncharacterized protein Tco025E_03336 [Trypanosoma conorhini]RNF21600.1 hypothetical protein Tco025E_03336 [Trypanosoma conorhini]